MNRIQKIMTIVTSLTAVICVNSCTKDNTPSQQDITQKIVGKWILSSNNGKECTTNSREVRTYFANGTGTRSIASLPSVSTEFVWDNKSPVSYTITGNEVCVWHNNHTHGLYSKVKEINEKSLSQHFFKVNNDGIISELSNDCLYKKVTNDYSNAIIGLWEGEEMTGEQTFGDIDARIEYKTDGTYNYYKKDGVNWVKSSDVALEYFVDGDWLAFRWLPASGQEYYYEWWDIDSITGTRMKISALREKTDGTRFIATFTWKKIN